MKLEEGKSYKFITVRKIVLPDSNENMILTGPDNKKYLLPLSYYKDYDLTGMKEIICKIDKINCSGKVYLEPQHPVYSEGECYSFKIMDLNSISNEVNTENSIIHVLDVFGNTLTVPVKLLDEVPSSSEITLKIEKISKGKIYFFKPREKEDVSELTEGQSYDFIIKAIEHDSEDEDNYVAFDVFNKKHYLPVRYYSHYGFRIGDTFRGKVIRYSAGGPKTIEPENPWYSPGDVVEVTVGSSFPDETGTGYSVEVFDNNGFNYSVKCNIKPLGQILKCSVLKIRKGKPVLIPLEE